MYGSLLSIISHCRTPLPVRAGCLFLLRSVKEIQESLPRSAELNLTNGFIRQLTSVRARDTCHAWPRSRWRRVPRIHHPGRNFGSHVEGRRRPFAKRRRAFPRVETTPCEIFMTENCPG